jgi:hypothetical protein
MNATTAPETHIFEITYIESPLSHDELVSRVRVTLPETASIIDFEDAAIEKFENEHEGCEIIDVVLS